MPGAAQGGVRSGGGRCAWGMKGALGRFVSGLSCGCTWRSARPVEVDGVAHPQDPLALGRLPEAHVGHAQRVHRDAFDLQLGRHVVEVHALRHILQHCTRGLLGFRFLFEHDLELPRGLMEADRPKPGIRERHGSRRPGVRGVRWPSPRLGVIAAMQRRPNGRI